MNNKQKNCIVICGPTASGKTHIAVSIAQKLHGEIVSADSRQVYKDMDIGTGKDINEYETNTGKIPYHCIDIVGAEKIYTLYHYQTDCYNAIKDIWTRNRVPVLAGGTGLYIEAVLKYYKIPNIPENRAQRIMLMKKDKQILLEELKNTDPKMYAQTDLSSKKRIVRSLEISLFSQNNPVLWSAKNPPLIKPVIFCVTWPRQELIERIDHRLQIRLNSGMVDEVQNLIDSGISFERCTLFGMEYKQIARYIFKQISYDTMVVELANDIHRLAKRQMTYFRGMERRGFQIHWATRVNESEIMKILEQNGFQSTLFSK